MTVLVNLTYDPEYKGYVADAPKLPGCMSQGKTIEKALMNITEAAALYLDTARRQITVIWARDT
jgi:predicted RNase H-like HicB family nuclease